MQNMLNEENQIHNFVSSSGSRSIIYYGSGSGSDFLTSYGSGSGSTSQKVTVPTVPVLVLVPQRWNRLEFSCLADFCKDYVDQSIVFSKSATRRICK
jgi:hypothetical protein